MAEKFVTAMITVLVGIGVSPGIARGPVCLTTALFDVPEPEPVPLRYGPPACQAAPGAGRMRGRRVITIVERRTAASAQSPTSQTPHPTLVSTGPTMRSTSSKKLPASASERMKAGSSVGLHKKGRKIHESWVPTSPSTRSQLTNTRRAIAGDGAKVLSR